eukprot:365084-Chlamydomonas_euryale.AAC.30
MSSRRTPCASTSCVICSCVCRRVGSRRLQGQGFGVHGGLSNFPRGGVRTRSSKMQGGWQTCELWVQGSWGTWASKRQGA